ncbi:MAG: amino acid adenylation domain-containing protein, partial [Psychrosphaera sp.]|nr:amino acid adenylation domain-containing protein [Psychrosphaera sp.]
SDKFVANPFSDDPQARMYKTADLVRWLPSGDLVYMGRVDNQVKLRGFRIELGEIEHQITLCDGIFGCVVLVREDRLVAYVVLNDALVDSKPHAPSDVAAIKSQLRDNLPDFMVPAFFVELDALPLTANGKIDKDALPTPAMDSGQTPYVAPSSVIEKQLCLMWQDTLGRDSFGRDGVGINDNFFDCGGHSLLATRIISQIRQIMSVELPLRTVFAQPTVAGLAGEISKLGTEPVLPILPDITKCSPTQERQLSFAQQRLWFIDELEGGSAQYNMPFAFTLDGELNLSAFKQALNTIIERHEVLRTQLLPTQGEARQVLQQSFELPLISIDLTDLNEPQQTLRVSELVEADMRQAFDLGSDILLRVQLLTLSMSSNVVLFNMHHIAGDGWSTGIIIKEFTTLYSAYAQNDANPLAPLNIQYADYAHWQRQWLKGDVLTSQLDYWTAQLAGIPTVHSLPLDKRRPAKQSFNGKAVQLEVDGGLTQQINDLCQQQGVTLFMALQTAFSVLLSRYSNETDIVMGSPIAGRLHQDVEPLIGFFVNTLVLRTNLEQSPSFSRLLQQNKQMILDAYTNQSVSFEMLVEAITPQRSLSHSPLFQVLFVLQNNEQQALTLPGLSLTPVERQNSVIKFDLELFITQTPQGQLSLRWLYNQDLYLPQTVKRMADNFVVLLGAMVQTPEQSINSLPLLSQSEQQLLRVQYNDTQADYPQHTLLHELFEQQVSQQPHHVALICGDASLTYQALNEAANRLAHHLMVQGVGVDSLVGILVSRSLEMGIALLAIMKAGAGYIPFDLAYPVARLQHMVSDSGLKFLLTQTGEADRLTLAQDVSCIELNNSAFSPLMQHYSRDNPSRTAAQHSGNIAYVIYTSGSTGMPKAAMVEHRSLVNLFVHLVDDYELNPQSQMLHVTSFGFDAALIDWALMMVSGATLHLVSQQTVMSAEALGAYAKNNRISFTFLPPALLNQLNPDDFKTLKTISIGGEAPNRDTVKVWAQGRHLSNVYGPAEATVITTTARLDPQAALIPIGKPVPNVRCLVLDINRQLAPLGCVGELYIGGLGVSRGYINRPELNLECFIEHTFADNNTERLYRTGDLVRYLPDGDLEFVGRTDNQVKIRGIRIELGEIEVQTGLLDGIKEAVVLARQDDVADKDKQLVAYIVFDVSATGDQPTVDQIRSQLGGSLPDFMVPNVFMVMDKLPLNPNGKVDRKALPAPAESDRQTDKYAPPTNDTEQTLCQMWQDLLQLEKVGINDNFFNLGGHSLLATRLVAKVKLHFSIDLSLRELFEQPTVRGLSGLIQNSQIALIEPLVPVSREQNLQLSFAQQRFWFLDQLEGASATYNVPIAIELNGTLDSAALERSLQTIVARHEILRTRFGKVGKQAVQLVDDEVSCPLVITDLQSLDPAQQQSRYQTLAEQEVNTRFDLNNGPLMRTGLIRLSQQRHVLLINMHHIVTDGWSMGVLVKELTALYSSFIDDGQNPLAPLPIQYADYAHWQRERMQGELLSNHIGYWQQQLADAPSLLALPTDRPRPVVPYHQGSSI